MGKRGRPVLVAICFIVSFSSIAYAQIPLLLPEIVDIPPIPQPAPDFLPFVAPVEDFRQPDERQFEPDPPEVPRESPTDEEIAAEIEAANLADCQLGASNCTGAEPLGEFWSCRACLRDCDGVDQDTFDKCEARVTEEINQFPSLDNDPAKERALDILRFLGQEWVRIRNFKEVNHLSGVVLRYAALRVYEEDKAEFEGSTNRARSFTNAAIIFARDLHGFENEAKEVEGDCRSSVGKVDDNDDGDCKEWRETRDCIDTCRGNARYVSRAQAFCTVQGASFQQNCTEAVEFVNMIT